MDMVKKINPAVFACINKDEIAKLEVVFFLVPLGITSKTDIPAVL